MDDEPTAIVHLTNRLKSHPEIEIVGEAGDVNSANDLVQTLKPDLIFLDIQMPKKNGFALLPKLENLAPQPAVVFVTAYDVPHPVVGAEKRLEAEDLVLLRDKSLSMMVKVGEIAAIEAHSDYTRILLNEGENLMMKQTLSLWESQLPTALFAKVSRRLLVNTQSVAKMVRKNLLTWELHLQGTKEPIQLSNLESKRLRALL